MDFEDIRPYNDSEAREVVDRIIADTGFLDTITGLKYPFMTKWFPFLLRGFARKKASNALKDVQTIEDFQTIVASSMWALVQKVTDGITIEGLSELNADTAHLFIGNHRDIVMDPALVGMSMDRLGRKALRIAIGDNLLTKPFVSDLMRLNRSFIVKRSVSGRREKLRELQKLSSYIRHSITEDSWPIWIAQSEGRAKDGVDRTDTALLKMIMLSKPKNQSFAATAHELNVVPISVSYELDPCDAFKARELYMKAEQGRYEKGAQEDVQSIYQGIVGEKGNIYVSFGKPLTINEVENANEMATAIDRHVIENYKLFPTNILAYERLHGADQHSVNYAAELNLDDSQWQQASDRFNSRIDAMPIEHQKYALANYANPVVSKVEFSTDTPVSSPS
jgi:1-acyl-sn-glycerol-3-phosphate acyltransferase